MNSRTNGSACFALFRFWARPTPSIPMPLSRDAPESHRGLGWATLGDFRPDLVRPRGSPGGWVDVAGLVRVRGPFDPCVGFSLLQGGYAHEVRIKPPQDREGVNTEVERLVAQPRLVPLADPEPAPDFQPQIFGC